MDKLNNQRAKLIDEINNFKLKVINKQNLHRDESQSRENFEERLISKCCFYLNTDTVNKYKLDNDSVGLVVFTEFNLNNNEWNELITIMNDLFDPEQEYSNIRRNEQLKLFFILEELKKAIANGQATAVLDSTIFDKVKSITTRSPSLCYLEDNPNCFRNLYKIVLERADISPSEDDLDYTDPLYLFPLANLKFLILNNCVLKVSVIREVFLASENLEELNIYKCKMDVPNDSIFSKLVALKSFSYIHSVLKCSPKFGLFTSLSNLKSLQLHSTFDPIIQLNSIYNLKNLEELRLRIYDIDCNNTELVEFITGLSLLKKLYLDGHVEIEKYLSKPIKLKSLSIPWFELDDDNLNIFKNLAELETLNIEEFIFDCNAYTFNEAIQYLTSLKALKIGFHNSFEQKDQRKTVAEDILTSLTKQLDKIKLIGANLECFNQLKINQLNLQEVYLESCSIKSVGEGIFKGMVNLKILNLSRNVIEVISNDAFQDLSNLVELYLSGNNIKQLNRNMLRAFKKLEKLNLNYNSLEYIDLDTFDSLENLKSLELQVNRIHKLENNHFKYLSNLEYLYLRGNLLESVDGIFDSLKKIKLIDVSDNKISTIDLSYFVNGFDYLNELNLNGNYSIGKIDEKILSYLVITKNVNVDLRWISDSIESMRSNMYEAKYKFKDE